MGQLFARELMLRGEPYDANDPVLIEERLIARERREALNALPFRETAARRDALERLLGAIGENVTVMSPLECDYGITTEIGDRTFINFGLIVLDSAPVSIGSDVQIGPRVQLLTPVHPLDPAERARLTETAAPITVADGVWLAAGVIVCAGVTIGEGSVIGAGSVVTRSMPARHLCVGNPCRAVRELPAG